MKSSMPRFFVWLYVAIGWCMMLFVPAAGVRIAMDREFKQDAQTASDGRHSPGFRIQGAGVQLLGAGIGCFGLGVGYLLAFKMRAATKPEDEDIKKVRRKDARPRNFAAMLATSFLRLNWLDRTIVAMIVVGLACMIIARMFFAQPYP